MRSSTAGALSPSRQAASVRPVPADYTKVETPCPEMAAKGRRCRPGESGDGQCGDQIEDRWAVPMPEAMRAMQLLVAEGRALVGAEYWMRFGNRYQPTHVGWAFRPRHDGEAWSGYVAESLFAAARGIELREGEWVSRECLLMIRRRLRAPRSPVLLARPGAMRHHQPRTPSGRPSSKGRPTPRPRTRPPSSA